jgi:chemotaxis family two-component system response regulator Rcp1
VNSKRVERPIQILLVEDNPGDARLTLEALKDGEVQNRLYVVNSGMEAIAFLRKKGKYADAPHPDFILLDLNMPLMNGSQLLAEVKQDSMLKNIPVAILTGSQAAEDIARAYNLHADCFVTKPIDLEEFIVAVKSIVDSLLNHHEIADGGRVIG